MYLYVKQMISFVPKTETTFEENEAQINKVKFELEDALQMRDYVKAAKLQQQLDYCMNVRNYCIQQANIYDKNTELDRLEKQRQQEEESLKQRMSQRMDKLLREYQLRFEQMERRHREDIERIDRKYSDSRYYTMRNSPSINVMLKAESFYGRHRDYAVAAAMKSQVNARTDAEFDALDTRTNIEIQGQIDSMTQKHELEVKGFRARLEAEKMKLNKETAKALMVMKNRYRKLRGRVLGLGESDPLPEHLRNEGRGVYQALESGFAPMLTMLDHGEFSPVPPLSARTMKGVTMAGVKTRGAPMTARNPRVQRALERSMMRKPTEQL